MMSIIRRNYSRSDIDIGLTLGNRMSDEIYRPIVGVLWKVGECRRSAVVEVISGDVDPSWVLWSLLTKSFSEAKISEILNDRRAVTMVMRTRNGIGYWSEWVVRGGRWDLARAALRHSHVIRDGHVTRARALPTDYLSTDWPSSTQPVIVSHCNGPKICFDWCSVEITRTRFEVNFVEKLVRLDMSPVLLWLIFDRIQGNIKFTIAAHRGLYKFSHVDSLIASYKDCPSDLTISLIQSTEFSNHEGIWILRAVSQFLPLSERGAADCLWHVCDYPVRGGQSGS